MERLTFRTRPPALPVVACLALLLMLVPAGRAAASARTYTLDADFDEGSLVNVNHEVVHDQLQLNQVTEPFPFIWVACSGEGTAVRIDVETGAVLGEYRTAPEGMGLDPSRTTVDLYGNVWVGNRAESSGGRGSVVKIGLVIGGIRGNKNPDGSHTPDPNGEYLAPPFSYSTAVDRDGDGYIRTSRGMNHVLGWPNVTDGAGGPDGIVQDAFDESILIFQRTNGGNVRHVSIDANNDVWVGNYPYVTLGYDKLDGTTGAILGGILPGCGGYGGLIDGNGVLWSAAISQSSLLRYDLTTGTHTCIAISMSYGLGIDTNGFIWNAMWSNNAIMKIDPAGNIVPGFPKPTGGVSSRGVAITPVDNHVWVANSGSNTVTRLDNNGNVLKSIGVGVTPTGVAVDANGKVWVTNYSSDSVMRIDPDANVDGLGAVDLTVALDPGATPYNYSDMTGMVAIGATAPQGAWTVVHDGANPGIEWGTVSWTSLEPEGTQVAVRVRAADTQAGLPVQPWLPVANGVPFSGVFGRYIEIQSILSRGASVPETPVLFDLSVVQRVRYVFADLHPRSCPNPLNVKKQGVVPAAILGTMDFDVALIDPASVRLEGVAALRWALADVVAPVVAPIDRCDCTTAGPDGLVDLTMKFEAQALVAAIAPVHDRDVVPMTFTGCLFDGTPIEGVDCMVSLGDYFLDLGGGEDDGDGGDLQPSGEFRLGSEGGSAGMQTVVYETPAAGAVRVTVFDVAGRLIDVLVSQFQEQGTHRVRWDAAGHPSGIYFYRLEWGARSATLKTTVLR